MNEPKTPETAPPSNEATDEAAILAEAINTAAPDTDSRADDFINNFEEATETEPEPEKKTKKEKKLSTHRKAISFVKFINFIQDRILRAVAGTATADFSYSEKEIDELTELAEDFADDINIPSWVWFALVLVAIETPKVVLAISLRKNNKKNTGEKAAEKNDDDEKNNFHEEKPAGRTRFKVDEKNLFVYSEFESNYLKKTDRTQRPTLEQMSKTLQANPDKKNQLETYFATL